jgi:hypothetical protein
MYDAELKDAQAQARSDIRMFLARFQRRWIDEAKAYIDKKGSESGYEISDGPALGREAAAFVIEQNTKGGEE